MKKYLPFVIIGAVLVVAVGAGWLLLRKDGSESSPLATTSKGATAAQSTATPDAKASGGQPDAAGLTKPNVKVGSPVVLEEYGDYQCPPCGQLYPELKKLEHEYGNQLQVVFRHFPLTKIHKNAMAAAHTAEAARSQNRFWEMHDLLYTHQRDWAELDDPGPVFTGYARQLNLNLTQFAQEVGSNVINQRISSDMQRGTSMGVTGTPTVFLDGNMLRYEATTPEGLRRGINVMLERKAEN